MDALLRIIVELFIAAGQGVYRMIKRPGWARAWAAAAEELGYSARGVSLKGEHDGVIDVIVDTVSQSAGQGGSRLYTRIVLSGPALPQHLSVAREGFFSRTFSGPDIQIGDKLADDALRITGDDTTALAILSADVRDRVITAIKNDAWVIESGQLTHAVIGVLDEDALVTWVREAVAFAEQLRTDVVTIDERLAHNARHDPIGVVRVRNLDALAARRGNSASSEALAVAAAAACLNDGDALVALAAQSIVPDDAALARFLPVATTFGQAVAARLAWLLGHRQLPGAEAALVALLDHADVGVQLEATRALAVSGSLAAVEPLYERASKRFGGDLKREARAAIEQIQARVAGDAQRGGLAVVAGGDAIGGLSAPDGPT